MSFGRNSRSFFAKMGINFHKKPLLCRILSTLLIDYRRDDHHPIAGMPNARSGKRQTRQNSTELEEISRFWLFRLAVYEIIRIFASLHIDAKVKNRSKEWRYIYGKGVYLTLCSWHFEVSQTRTPVKKPKQQWMSSGYVVIQSSLCPYGYMRITCIFSCGLLRCSFR